MFVYLHSQAPRVLYTQGTTVADLLLIAVKRTVKIAGKFPTHCVVPLVHETIEAFIRECWQWAYLALVLQITIDNHYP